MLLYPSDRACLGSGSAYEHKYQCSARSITWSRRLNHSDSGIYRTSWILDDTSLLDMAITPKYVAVIGAGPSGLAAASYLCAEGCTVTLIEQKACPGGLWNAETDLLKRRWERPVYDSLETNVPRQLMTFSDKPWPATTPLFPPHSQVQAYLHSYAQGLKKQYKSLTIGCDRQVSRVKKETRKGYNSPIWAVDQGVLDLARNTRTYTGYYHAVVVATGTYQRAFIPDYEGLEEWAMSDKESHVHSLYYSDTQPESYIGQVRRFPASICTFMLILLECTHHWLRSLGFRHLKTDRKAC